MKKKEVSFHSPFNEGHFTVLFKKTEYRRGMKIFKLSMLSDNKSENVQHKEAYY
jgi:hypothetical protein